MGTTIRCGAWHGGPRPNGRFPALEDQLAAITYQGYQGPGSPDRADAMVWAMTKLFDRAPAGPRIVQL